MSSIFCCLSRQEARLVCGASLGRWAEQVRPGWSIGLSSCSCRLRGRVTILVLDLGDYEMTDARVLSSDVIVSTRLAQEN